MQMQVSDMDRRLQSLKLPRDLTLGGTKPKKVFIPNINATRNKEKKEFFIIKTEGQKKTNRTDLRNNKKGLNRCEKFIQSSGIFADGVGSDALKKVRYERAYVPRDDTNTTKTAASAPVSLPNAKASWQASNTSAINVYEDITDQNSAIVDKKEKVAFKPRTWNESDMKEKKVYTTTKPNIKPALVPKDTKNNIKTEPMLQKQDLDNFKTELNNIPQEFNEVDNVDNLKPGLSLWKLPNSFCGKGFSDDPNVKTLIDYKLPDLLESQIGKMRIHKSGKVDVQIGSVKYRFDASQLNSSAEKIIALDTKKGSVNCIVLGHVRNRYMLNPNWTSLLKDL